MPITFKTKSHADITMLSEIGEKMIEMMDFGNTVPGGIVTKDLRQALSNLQNGLSKDISDEGDTEVAENEEVQITLDTRALPLINLIQSAIDGEHHLRWD